MPKRETTVSGVWLQCDFCKRTEAVNGEPVSEVPNQEMMRAIANKFIARGWQVSTVCPSCRNNAQ